MRLLATHQGRGPPTCAAIGRVASGPDTGRTGGAPPLPPPARTPSLPHRALAVAAATSLSLGVLTSTPPPAWSTAVAAGGAPAIIAAAELAKPLPPPWSPSDPPLATTSLPPLRNFTPPKVERATLANGLRILFVPDRDTPTVRGVLIMRGGSRAAPAARPAVASLAATVQRSGGSTSHPGSTFDDALDAMAASIEAVAAADGTSIGFEGLAPDLAPIMNLVGELVTSPALPPPKLALAQASAVDALRHRDDAPGSLPGREAAKLVYGKGSVHARSPTIEGVMGTTPADLRAFLGAWQRPDAAVLAVVGDGSLNSVVEAVKASPLGSEWAALVPGPPPPLPDTPLADRASYAGRTFLVDRPGLAQATVVLAEPGVLLTDVDAPSLDILGGALSSFGGRLFDGLRSRDGLAYSVSAGWDTGRADHVGLFIAGGSTADPAKFLEGLVAALDGLGTGGAATLSTNEVGRAREQAINGFVFNFASPDALASRAASLALADLDPDYLATYRAGLGAVSPASVAAAAAAHLHPRGGAVAVVVGDARTVRPALEALGRGPVVDLVPEPVSKVKVNASVAAVSAAATAAPGGGGGGGGGGSAGAGAAVE